MSMPPEDIIEQMFDRAQEYESEGSEESLMSEEEENEKDAKLTQGLINSLQQQASFNIIPDCILLQKMEVCKGCESLHSLLQAHIDLDDLREGRQTKDLWQGVWTFLKGFINSEDDVLFDVRRDFRRRQISFPESIFTHSTVRLQARLDRLFLQEIDDERDQVNIPAVRSPAYTSKLSNPEHKAFNACLQVWRKSFRGKNELFSRSSISRWATCVEISALCGRGRDELVYCAGVGQNWRKEEREPYLVTNSWYDLTICCTSIFQWKSAIITLLPQLPSLRRCSIQTHDRFMANTRDLMSSLPPFVYSTDIKYSGCGDNWEVRNVATLDSLTVCTILHAYRSERRKQKVSHQLSSLLAFASMVIQQNQDSSGMHNLPGHLQIIVQSAYRCVSCKKIVIPPAQINEEKNLFSTNFQRAARSAGFSLQHAYETTLVSSLKAGSDWLPPFDETVGFLHDSLDGFSFNSFWLKARTEPKSDPRTTLKKRGWQWVKIGGYYASQEKEGDGEVKEEEDQMTKKVEEGLAWRFCLPCGAAHLWVDGYGGKCQCTICKVEKHLLEGKRKTRWLRYVYSDQPPQSN